MNTRVEQRLSPSQGENGADFQDEGFYSRHNYPQFQNYIPNNAYQLPHVMALGFTDQNSAYLTSIVNDKNYAHNPGFNYAQNEDRYRVEPPLNNATYEDSLAFNATQVHVSDVEMYQDTYPMMEEMTCNQDGNDYMVCCNDPNSYSYNQNVDSHFNGYNYSTNYTQMFAQSNDTNHSSSSHVPLTNVNSQRYNSVFDCIENQNTSSIQPVKESSNKRKGRKRKKSEGAKKQKVNSKNKKSKKDKERLRKTKYLKSMQVFIQWLYITYGYNEIKINEEFEIYDRNLFELYEYNSGRELKREDLPKIKTNLTKIFSNWNIDFQGGICKIISYQENINTINIKKLLWRGDNIIKMWSSLNKDRNNANIKKYESRLKKYRGMVISDEQNLILDLNSAQTELFQNDYAKTEVLISNVENKLKESKSINEDNRQILETLLIITKCMAYFSSMGSYNQDLQDFETFMKNKLLYMGDPVFLAIIYYNLGKYILTKDHNRCKETLEYWYKSVEFFKKSKSVASQYHTTLKICSMMISINDFGKANYYLNMVEKDKEKLSFRTKNYHLPMIYADYMLKIEKNIYAAYQIVYNVSNNTSLSNVLMDYEKTEVNRKENMLGYMLPNTNNTNY